MELSRFNYLNAEIAGTASAVQILQLEGTVHQFISSHVTDVALARRTVATIAKRTCPHCTCHDVVLHGKDQNRRQRFLCRTCGKTYNIMTGTPMARARKPEKWCAYLGFMTDHTTVRRIVQAGICLNHVTVWRWRHRFLAATAHDNAALLCGVIEVDDIFFPRSFKGHRGWQKGVPPANRNARGCSGDAGRSGRTNDRVPVLTALDSSGGICQDLISVPACLGSVLDGRIAAGSVLCSNGAPALRHLAAKARAEHWPDVGTMCGPDQDHRSRPMDQPPAFLGLDRVNEHHDQLKALVNGRCCGVATKYLRNYLGWHRCMCHSGFVGTTLLTRALV